MAVKSVESVSGNRW